MTSGGYQFRVGHTIIVDPGDWVGGSVFEYQWRRNGVNIIGANQSRYTLLPSDEGTLVSCIVRASDESGAAEATSMTIGPIAPV